MSATTVKLQGPILRELHSIRPKGTTLTALVRDLLEAEIRRRRMARAAADYVAFLGAHPEESGDMDAWSAAPLEHSPRARSRRRRG